MSLKIWTPLHLACRRGNETRIKQLLKMGVHPDQQEQVCSDWVVVGYLFLYTFRTSIYVSLWGHVGHDVAMRFFLNFLSLRMGWVVAIMSSCHVMSAGLDSAALSVGRPWRYKITGSAPQRRGLAASIHGYSVFSYLFVTSLKFRQQYLVCLLFFFSHFHSVQVAILSLSSLLS